VTSHSPAFFTLSGDNVLIRRITRDAKNDATIPQLAELETKNLTSELEEELGLLEFQKEFQKKYETAVAMTEAERVGLEKLKIEISSKTSPILLVEGKWDVKVLQEAWVKLFPTDQIPFRLFSCDTTDEDSGEGSAGCGALKLGLESVRADEPLTVGIFDRDNEGFKKGFNCLSKNFKPSSFSQDVKVQKTGTAAAMLLPVPLGRESYAKAFNLPLEFYFNDESLMQQIDGKGLVLKPRKIHQHIEGLFLDMDQTVSHEPYHRQIEKASKKHFSEKVVPALPATAFEKFRPLFALVQKTFQELQSIKSPSA
jgi:hypothetical protein